MCRSALQNINMPQRVVPYAVQNRRYFYDILYIKTQLFLLVSYPANFHSYYSCGLSDVVNVP